MDSPAITDVSTDQILGMLAATGSVAVSHEDLLARAKQMDDNHSSSSATGTSEEAAHEEVNLDALSPTQLNMLAKEFRTGVEKISKAAASSGIMLESVFQGKAAVDWAVANAHKIISRDHALSRTQAIQLLLHLQDKRGIYTFCENQKREFADDNTYFQLIRDALVNNALTKQYLRDIVSLMIDVQKGIQIHSDRNVIGLKVQNVFTKAEAENWIQRHFSPDGVTQEDAHVILKHFIHRGIMEKKGVIGDLLEFDMKTVNTILDTQPRYLTK